MARNKKSNAAKAFLQDMLDQQAQPASKPKSAQSASKPKSAQPASKPESAQSASKPESAQSASKPESAQSASKPESAEKLIACGFYITAEQKRALKLKVATSDKPEHKDLSSVVRDALKEYFENHPI